MRTPARMTFEEVAREADRARRRLARAARRPATIKLRDSYKAGEVNRLVDDWIASIMHPDDEMRWSLRRIRARAREQARNNPFAKAYLGALTVNVLGPSGPRLQAQVRDNSGTLNQRINSKIEDAFYDWALRPTVDGKLSFGAMSHLALRTIANDGEVFVRMWEGFEGNPYLFALELIDADQVDELYNVAAGGRQPEVRLGVEVDVYGRPLAYHVWNRPERSFSMLPRDRVRIPASQIIHLYAPERANQTRGLPWATVVMWALRMLEGFSESAAVAARASAAKMGFWTKKPKEGTYGEIPTDKETGKITMDVSPGTFDFAPDGYELQAWDPQHPNADYGEFVKAKLREIASGLGMSYNALANDLEGVNYSSMRSGLLIEREVWRVVQQQWIDSFLRPVYEVWLNMALLSRALVLDSRDTEKFKAHRWAPRGWPWVDPLKDTTAGIAGIQAGLTSRTRLLAEQGLDPETILEELKSEKEMAAQAGIDISGPAPKPGFGGASVQAEVERIIEEMVEDGSLRNGASRAAVLAALRR